MAMGRRRQELQEAVFIATDGLATFAGHPFYRKLNELLAEAGFDRCPNVLVARSNCGLLKST